MKKTVLNLIAIFCTGILFSQNITDNLIAHYEFTNGDVTDLSGNNNDAVNVGGSVTTGIANATNEALSLASGNYIALPSGILLKSSLSISLWFKSSNSGGLIGYQNTAATSTPSQNVPIAYLGTDNKLKATYWQGVQTQVQGSNLNYANGAWHHLVLTVRPNLQKVYIDGVLTGTANSGHTILPGMTYNQIGKAYTNGWDNSPSGWHSFFGSIDKVRIYDTDLHESTISTLYDLEVTGGSILTPIDELLADYLFIDGVMVDSSTYERDAVNAGSTPATDRFGNIDQAVALDGSSHIKLPSGILLGATRSVSVWFKTATSGSILGYQNTAVGTTPTQNVPIAYLRTDNKLSAAFWSNSVDATANSSITNYADDVWHHLVLTTAGSTQNVYIDNMHTGSISQGHSILAAMTHNQIGTSYADGWNQTNNGWFNFTGSLDDLKIYSKQLTIAEIDALFNLSDPGTVTALFDTNEEESFTIYPNPASNLINTDKGEIEILNALGALVLRTVSTGVVDVSGLETGVYFVKQNGKQSKLIIK